MGLLEELRDGLLFLLAFGLPVGVLGLLLSATLRRGRGSRWVIGAWIAAAALSLAVVGWHWHETGNLRNVFGVLLGILALFYVTAIGLGGRARTGRRRRVLAPGWERREDRPPDPDAR